MVCGPDVRETGPSSNRGRVIVRPRNPPIWTSWSRKTIFTTNDVDVLSNFAVLNKLFYCRSITDCHTGVSRLSLPWTGLLGQRNTLSSDCESLSSCVNPFIWLFRQHLAPRMMWKLWATSSLIKYDETLCIVLQAEKRITERTVNIGAKGQLVNSLMCLCKQSGATCFYFSCFSRWIHVHYFSRPWRRLHVRALRSDWFIEQFTFVVIGQMLYLCSHNNLTSGKRKKTDLIALRKQIRYKTV